MMHGAREVRPRHSSWEADEQGGAIRCGAGGAKGGGRGECEPAKHAPDAESGKRVTGAGAHTASQRGKGRRRGSPRSSTTSASICSTEAFFELKADAAPGVDGLTLDGLRGKTSGAISRTLHDSRPSGSISGTAVAAGVHPEAGWPTAAHWYPNAGREDRPTGDRQLLNAIYEEDFLGFSCGFRPGRGTHDALDALWSGSSAEGELHTGRRHPIVLRRDQPGMADPLRGASDRRPAHHPPDPEMAQGGRAGRRDRNGQ